LGKNTNYKAPHYVIFLRHSAILFIRSKYSQHPVL